jgi:hypothetical protein
MSSPRSVRIVGVLVELRGASRRGRLLVELDRRPHQLELLARSGRARLHVAVRDRLHVADALQVSCTTVHWPLNGTSTSRHLATVLAAITSFTSSTAYSPFCISASCVAKRSSVLRSGRPTTRQKSGQ